MYSRCVCQVPTVCQESTIAVYIQILSWRSQLTSLTRVICLSYFVFKFKKREINGNDSALTRSFQDFQETSSTFKIH